MHPTYSCIWRFVSLLQANARQWVDSMILTPIPESISLHDAVKNGLLLRKITDALLESRDALDGTVPRVTFDPVKDMEQRKPAHKVTQAQSRHWASWFAC